MRAWRIQSSSLSMKTIIGGPLVLALSVALRTPFDIVEQQLQLANAQLPGAVPPQSSAGEDLKKLRPTVRSIKEKIQATWKAEGVRGVWRGYPAAFCGIATYIAGYFVIYEGVRSHPLERTLALSHPHALSRPLSPSRPHVTPRPPSKPSARPARRRHVERSSSARS